MVLERSIADATAPDAKADVTIAVPPVAAADAPIGDQVESARRALQALQARLTPEHPDVIRAKRQLRDLEAQLPPAGNPAPAPAPVVRMTAADTARQIRVRNLQAEVQNLDRQIANRESEEQRLRGVMAAYQARVEAAPTRESELIELTRDYTTLQQVYTNLLAKREDSKVAANLERRQAGEQFRILDPARRPERPFSPNRMSMNLMGALAGLGIGLGLVALLEYRDTTLRTDDDVVMAVSLPVLAMIPMMVTSAEQRQRCARAGWWSPARRRRWCSAPPRSYGRWRRGKCTSVTTD